MAEETFKVLPMLIFTSRVLSGGTRTTPLDVAALPGAASALRKERRENI